VAIAPTSSTLAMSASRSSQILLPTLPWGASASLGFPGATYVERFAAMGAPWRFGINDLKAIAKTTGMTIVDNVKTADLYKTYCQGIRRQT